MYRVRHPVVPPSLHVDCFNSRHSINYTNRGACLSQCLTVHVTHYPRDVHHRLHGHRTNQNGTSTSTYSTGSSWMKSGSSFHSRLKQALVHVEGCPWPTRFPNPSTVSHKTQGFQPPHVNCSKSYPHVTLEDLMLQQQKKLGRRALKLVGALRIGRTLPF